VHAGCSRTSFRRQDGKDREIEGEREREREREKERGKERSLTSWRRSKWVDEFTERTRRIPRILQLQGRRSVVDSGERG